MRVVNVTGLKWLKYIFINLPLVFIMCSLIIHLKEVKHHAMHFWAHSVCRWWANVCMCCRVSLAALLRQLDECAAVGSSCCATSLTEVGIFIIKLRRRARPGSFTSRAPPVWPLSSEAKEGWHVAEPSLRHAPTCGGGEEKRGLGSFEQLECT